ncbi:Co-chaperone protein isoform 3 [Schistosoma japonicum]|uniref:Co-chaperone protein isoform 3 n=1 Tax=Schistosoma japonicum TaxID=6182 RepID=A0A4Z2DXX5_SCHJA|nr:Co-chaperone protein isoform 3 [Schistosoma japonicum]
MSGDHGVAVHPSLLWAQRNDCLYITVSISDVKSQSVNVNDKSLEFRYYMAYLKLHFSEPRLVKTNRQTMKLNLTYMDKSAQRYAGVYKPNYFKEPKVTTSGREVVICIKKKEPGAWPRLLSQQTKCPWLKTDFSRWKDEDDSEPDVEGNNFSNMLSQMSNFGDYGGDDGVDGDLDSDDEDLPDLEMPHADAEKSEENGTEEAEEKKPESTA